MLVKIVLTPLGSLPQPYIEGSCGRLPPCWIRWHQGKELFLYVIAGYGLSAA